MSGSADEVTDESVTSAAVTAWAKVVRVSQSLLSDVEADLKAAGFPPLAWYDVLLELHQAGAAGLRPVALQRRMLLAQYNMSRLLERMENGGVIVRDPCPDDARGQIVRATTAGEVLRGRMWPAYRAAIRAHFANKLSARQVEDLNRLLDQLA